MLAYSKVIHTVLQDSEECFAEFPKRTRFIFGKEYFPAASLRRLLGFADAVRFGVTDKVAVIRW